MRSFLGFRLLILCFVLFVSDSKADTFIKPSTFYVNSISELRAIFSKLKNTSEPAIILVEAGMYVVSGSRLVFPRDNIKLLGITGDPKDIVFDGGGMIGGVGFIFDVSHSNISISGVTLRNVTNHLIQVRAERGASDFSLTNCVMQDAYEQLFKVSASHQLGSPYSERGKISGCTFEYTAGVGPQFYIGGINAHRAKNWIVSNNIFIDIASPDNKKVAQHAIHFWRGSENTTVKNNIIINADRGIGFGLGNPKTGKYEHKGGFITDNIIFNEGKKNHKMADAGIILENARDTIINDNYVFMQQSYRNAIEYRFKNSVNNLISNNFTNRRIVSRNGGSAIVEGNQKLDKEIALSDALSQVLPLWGQ